MPSSFRRLAACSHAAGAPPAPLDRLRPSRSLVRSAHASSDRRDRGRPAEPERGGAPARRPEDDERKESTRTPGRLEAVGRSAARRPEARTFRSVRRAEPVERWKPDQERRRAPAVLIRGVPAGPGRLADRPGEPVRPARPEAERLPLPRAGGGGWWDPCTQGERTGPATTQIAAVLLIAPRAAGGARMGGGLAQVGRATRTGPSRSGPVQEEKSAPVRKSGPGKARQPGTVSRSAGRRSDGRVYARTPGGGVGS